MDVAAFTRSIRFRFFRPQSPLERYRRAQARLSGLGVSLEVLNTRLPARRRELRARLAPLLEIPRMSTYAMAAIVNVGVSEMPAESVFLNIGLWHGFTFFAGTAGNAGRVSVGVDNFSLAGTRPARSGTVDLQFDAAPRGAFLERFERLRGPLDAFHEIDFRDYLSDVHDGAPIGFYVYDAAHSYEGQLAGLELAEPYFVPGTVILVDDMNWQRAREATFDFVRARPDRYELAYYRPTGSNMHPTFWNGIALLRRTSAA